MNTVPTNTVSALSAPQPASELAPEQLSAMDLPTLLKHLGFPGDYQKAFSHVFSRIIDTRSVAAGGLPALTYEEIATLFSISTNHLSQLRYGHKIAAKRWFDDPEYNRHEILKNQFPGWAKDGPIFMALIDKYDQLPFKHALKVRAPKAASKVKGPEATSKVRAPKTPQTPAELYSEAELCMAGTKKPVIEPKKYPKTVRKKPVIKLKEDPKTVPEQDPEAVKKLFLKAGSILKRMAHDAGYNFQSLKREMKKIITQRRPGWPKITSASILVLSRVFTGDGRPDSKADIILADDVLALICRTELGNPRRGKLQKILPQLPDNKPGGAA